MNATTSVEERADAIVDGIERRRKVYAEAIGLVQAHAHATTGPIAARVIGREARTMVPQLEAEIAGLGRYFGGTSVGIPVSDRPTTAA